MWFLHTKNNLTRSLSQSLTKAFGVRAYIRHTKPEKKKKWTKRKTNDWSPQLDASTIETSIIRPTARERERNRLRSNLFLFIGRMSILVLR